MEPWQEIDELALACGAFPIWCVPLAVAPQDISHHFPHNLSDHKSQHSHFWLQAQQSVFG
jgi:hypothetical protein